MNQIRFFNKTKEWNEVYTPHNFIDSIRNSFVRNRIRIVTSTLTPIIKNKTVVDFGAGNGMFSKICVQLGAKKVISIENNILMYDELKENMKSYENIKVVYGNEDNIPKCDILLCLGVITYHKNISCILKKINEQTRNIIIINTIPGCKYGLKGLLFYNLMRLYNPFRGLKVYTHKQYYILGFFKHFKMSEEYCFKHDVNLVFRK